MKAADYIEKEKEAYFTTLRDIVNINSFSGNKAGVDKVAECLCGLFSNIGYNIEKISCKEFGDHIIVSNKASLGEKYFLLAGHMDTVVPVDNQRNYIEDEEKCYGSGVIDMKSGLVLGYFIAKYFIDNSMEKIPLVYIFNSDEEIGSITSAELIKKLASKALCAIVLEPGRANGDIVSSRKGVGRFEFNIHGVAAHSGGAHSKGRSAILASAYKVMAVEKLTDYGRGITVNCGIIRGGTASNVVPEHAKVCIDVRIQDNLQADEVRQKLEEIAGKVEVQDTETSISGKFTRLPMIKTKKIAQMVERYKNTALKYGIIVQDTSSGGGSDANHIAQVGCPVLCGLGPVGDKAHTKEEFLYKQSVSQRFSILADFLWEIWSNYDFYVKEWDR